VLFFAKLERRGRPAGGGNRTNDREPGAQRRQPPACVRHSDLTIPELVIDLIVRLFFLHEIQEIRRNHERRLLVS
jgi:hypothetical protein